MEENKHSHRKKHSHSRHHQDRRLAVNSSSGGTSSLRDVPVFGALRERDSGELQKIAQNVLGNYDDYQSALDKMDLNEQMKYLVGVAESTHCAAVGSAKPANMSAVHTPVTGRMTGAAVVGSEPPAVSSRRDKSKKTHKNVNKKPCAVDACSSAPQMLSSNIPRLKRKRVVIRGSNLMAVRDADKPCPLPSKERHIKTPPPPPASPLAVSSKPPLILPSPFLGLSHDVATGGKSQVSEPAQNLASRTKREKKIRKKRNSPPQVKHGNNPIMRPVTDAPPLPPPPPPPPPPPEQMKQRPVALNLPGHGSHNARSSGPGYQSGTSSGPGHQSGSSSGLGHQSGSNSGPGHQSGSSCGPGYQSGSSSGPGHQSDGPDTGDVQHMLDELLHPPSLSLVTPIPTPKTFTPFVFPTLSSTSQPRAPSKTSAADRLQCSSVMCPQPKPSSLLSSQDSTSQKLSGRWKMFECEEKSRRTNRRTNSSSSDSSCSSSGSSDSSSTSSGSSSSNSSDSNGVATEKYKCDGEISPHKPSDSKMFEYKEEETRQALEKFQAILTASNVAITPLKKTPPHLMCTSEEVANVSPANYSSLPTNYSSLSTHTTSAFTLASQASQGFQVMLPNGRFVTGMSDDGDDGEHNSDSDSDSESASDNGEPAAEENPVVGDGGGPSLEVGEACATTPQPNQSHQVVHRDFSSDHDGVNSFVLDYTSASPSSSSSSFKKKSRKTKRKCENSDMTLLPMTALKKPKSCISYPVIPVGSVDATITTAAAAAPLLRTTGVSVPLLPLRGVGVSQDVAGIMVLDVAGGVTHDVAGGVTHDVAGGVTHDVAGGVTHDVAGGVTTGQVGVGGLALTALSHSPSTTSSLLVRIPLADLKLVEGSSQQQLPKPKATVEPYNVRSTASSRATPQRRNTSETMPPDQEESRGGPSRDHYGGGGSNRLRTEEYGSVVRDPHTGRPRSHAGHRWDREERDRRTYGMVSHGGGGGGGGGGRACDYGGGRVGGGGEYAVLRSDYSGGRGGSGDFGGGGRGHGWDREPTYRGNTVGEEYWSDTGLLYDGPRIDLQRGAGGGRRMYPSGNVGGSRMDPEYYMQEARRRKKEADKIMVLGLDKAKLYMESVTYFMRHGGAIEEGLGSGSNSANKRNPYKMYCDTVNMIKYCHAMAADCKPLLVLCLRCRSALHWRMFLIKQPNAALLHKDLQEFFLPSKSKSPLPGGGFSPLPSPASVGSTASTGSGNGGGTCGISDSSSVSVPRLIFSRAAEHLTVSTHVHTCLELWRRSDSYMEQCREFFLNADRKASLTVHYYSSIFQVASWVEDILKSV